MFSIKSPSPTSPPTYKKADKQKHRHSDIDSLNIAPLDLAYEISLKNFHLHVQKRLEYAPSKAFVAHEFVNAWYNNNASSIHLTTNATAFAGPRDVDQKLLVAAIKEFNDTCHTFLGGLDTLCLLHPFVKVAVNAFRNVLSFIPANTSNKRVAWLKIQMREMMVVLFQLRHIKDSEEKGPDGVSIQDRLKGLMEKIAMDIEEMGSVCEAHLKKSLVAQILHYQFWNERLSSYADVFVENRRFLHLVLDDHANIGSDEMNPTLPELNEVRSALSAFFKLSTPREDKIRWFISEMGGGKACIENDQLLAELIRMSGEGVHGITLEYTGEKTKDLAAARKKLIKDLEEDLGMELTRNLIIFRRKLEMQAISLYAQEEHISFSLSNRPCERVIDPDLRNIWKNMGNGNSMKGRHFVLALHDYLVEKFVSEAHSRYQKSTHTSQPASARANSELWTLSYINAAYTQSILEVLDEEALGLVTIKGLNNLFFTKPLGWTLPSWVAYWAAGWHISVHNYRTKIYRLIQRMMEAAKNVHALNQRHVFEYLAHDTFHRIELLLRSTEPAPYKVRSDPHLRKLVDTYTEYEERRLDKRLKSIAYELDGVTTISLVAGPGKIEKYMYPLLYLLLKRDMHIFQLAHNNILDPDELWDRNLTLLVLFNAFDERVHELTEGFFHHRRMRETVHEQLQDHAFGMMHLSFNTPGRNPSHNTLHTFNHFEDDDDDEEMVFAGAFHEDDGSASYYDSDNFGATKLSVDTLKYRDRNNLESTIYDFGSDDSHIRCSTENSFQGAWAGHLWVRDDKELVSIQGLVQLYLDEPDSQGNVFGKAFTYSGCISVSGNITAENNVFLTLERDGFKIHCTGVYDHGSDTITGSHEIDGYIDEFLLPPLSPLQPTSKVNHEETDMNKSARPYGLLEEGNAKQKPKLKVRVNSDFKKRPPGRSGSGQARLRVSLDDCRKSTRAFIFTRTSLAAWRFRYSQEHFLDNPARARWAFACTAVLDRIRRRRLSWIWLAKRFHERRRFLELDIRDHLLRCGYTPTQPLTTQETRELNWLKQILDPVDARFYRSLIPSIIAIKYTWHLGRTCNSCKRMILQSHLLCIRCIDDRFLDSVDLCQSCMNTTPESRHRAHSLSHSLVRLHTPLLDGDLAWIIPKAREVSDRVKDLCRAKAELIKQLTINQRQTASPVITPGTSNRMFKATTCGCCRTVTTFPCWVCLECSPDTFVCSDCETQSRFDGTSSIHKSSHILLRIYDSNSESVCSVDSSNDQYVSLERRIVHLETRLNSRFEERFTSLESRLKSLERQFDSRLEGVEGLLQQIMTYTNTASGGPLSALARPMGPRKPSGKPKRVENSPECSEHQAPR